jgi:hypothetical protein
MKENIRSLEGRLTARGETVIHKMLEEDGECMRKALLKLEGVNDKLNHDIAKLKEDKVALDAQFQESSKLNEELKK